MVEFTDVAPFHVIHLEHFLRAAAGAEGEESATLGARCRKGCADISASTWKMSRQGARLALTVLVGEGKL